MSRKNLTLAVALSLVLHGGLLAWMVTQPPPPPASASRPLQLELWFEPEAAATPPAPAPAPAPAPQRPPPAQRVAARAPEAQPPSPPSSPAGADSPTAGPPEHDVPGADVAPRPNLALPQPHLAGGPEGVPEAGSGHGETVYPDDPRFSAEARRADAEKRVKGRVSGWAEDTLAEARAQRGLPHPYFTAVRDAARAGLGKLADAKGLRATFGQAAQALAGRYLDSASNYARSGDPGLGPPGQAPRLSERLVQPETQALKALAQATETFDDLGHGKPLLTLTLELRQTRDQRSKAVVLKASLDPSFDAFVLEAWPTAIAAAGPPPADAFRSDELRSIWEIEGWPAASALDKAMTYVPDPGVFGVPLARVLPGATSGYRYEFHARLLRAY
jgi:hypothetical protein